jgi:hypothetical protein
LVFIWARWRLRWWGWSALTATAVRFLARSTKAITSRLGSSGGKETTGWIAISENYYRHRNFFTLLKDPCDPKSAWKDDEIPPNSFAWLRKYTPVAMVGSSIRLYHLQGDGQ